MKTMKMPELSEHNESSDTEQPPTNGGPASCRKTPGTLGTSGSTPQIAVTSDDNDATSRSEGDGEQVVRPPSPSEEAVTPSIPDSFLKKLGLSTASKDLVNGEQG